MNTLRSRRLRPQVLMLFAAIVGIGIFVFLFLSTTPFYTQAKTSQWGEGSVSDITVGSSYSCAVASGAAYCWGLNNRGQLGDGSLRRSYGPQLVDKSTGLEGKTVTSISAGSEHACAVADGAVYCWGFNDNGQLGNNTTTPSSVPVAVDVVTGGAVLADKEVSQVAAADDHTCALAEGIAYCWGLNTGGQLGNNTTTTSPIPVVVGGVLGGQTVTDISLGQVHTCAVATATAYCWGSNLNGRGGAGAAGTSSVPRAVSGAVVGKSVTAIANGSAHSCAVADGAAYCWGNNTRGRLGTNNTTTYTTATAVDVTAPPAALQGKMVTDIAAGSAHSCALAGGAAYCWGENYNGKLGSGVASISSSVALAVDATGELAGKTVTKIAGGSTSGCAVANASSYCWGFSDNGQIGDLTTASSQSPISTKVHETLKLSLSRFFEVGSTQAVGEPIAAANEPAALTSAGEAFRLRMGVDSQVAISNEFTQVASGFDATCSLVDGVPHCWGSNGSGQQGGGDAIAHLTPFPVETSSALAGKNVTAIAHGRLHACAIADGAAYCWGSNSNGQLGTGDTNNAYGPVAVSTATGVSALAGKTVTAISAGTYYTCAVADGAAYCWGINSGRQLGNGGTVTSNVPIAVSTLAGTSALAGKTVTSISAGDAHTCAVADEAAYCWGTGGSYQLGNESNASSGYPVAVSTGGFTAALAGKTVTAVSAGTTHSCALADGEAYCWGGNANGLLGSGNTLTATSPIAVSTVGAFGAGTVTAISAGSSHTCAIADDDAYCWGSNLNGRLGGGSGETNSLVPLAVDATATSGQAVSAISVGVTHTCLVAAGAPYCWGSSGQIGTGESIDASLPVPARTILPGSELMAGAGTFKLQYAQKVSSTCVAQSSGFDDVTETSEIAWSQNSNAAHGVTIVPSVNDPTDSARTIYQTHVSQGSEFTNLYAIPYLKTGLWDFSLRDNSGLSQATYCLKIVRSDGSKLEATDSMAEVTTASVGTSIAYVDSDGEAVGVPTFSLASRGMLAACQSTAGQLGLISGNRLRVSQSAADSGWSVSLAPTNGATAVWSNDDATAHYDFNDSSGNPAGCNSGSDGDGLAGQLSLDASSTNVAPQDGCSVQGLSWGGGVTAFESGQVDAITLLTASSSSQAGCYWDLYGTAVQQTIPASQGAGEYSIQLTATVVVQ